MDAEKAMELLDDAVANGEREHEEINQKLDARIGRIKANQGDTQRGQQLIEGARAEAEEAHEAVEEKVADKVGMWRQKALDDLQERRQRVRTEQYEKQLLDGSEAWAEAEARRGFVEEDLEELSAQEIAERGKRAKRAGDEVGLFLILRYGRERLAAQMREAQDVGKRIQAQRARAELTALTDEEEIEDRLRELKTLEAEVQEPRGRAELEARREEISRRFGIEEAV